MEKQRINNSSAFAPQPAAGYQQYPVQAWPAPAAPPPNQYQSYPPPAQQYGPPATAPQYSYNQASQPYNAPPAPQYGRPTYQAPPNNPYGPPAGPSQFGTQGYIQPQQPYPPPVTAPYQPPQSHYPPNPGYSSTYQAPPKSFSSQSQWHGTSNANRANHPRQQRSNSGYKRDFSNNPSQQSQRQPSQQYQQPFQALDYGSEGPTQSQQIPQTPISNNGSAHQGPAQSQNVSSLNAEAASVQSTPHVVDESGTVIEANAVKQDPLSSSEIQGNFIEQEEKPEEGEIGPEDDVEEEFQWDFEHAFEEIKPKETVALAQPLSASFKSTPVPLIQAWSIKVPSISRYARKDNLNEYVRPIRSSPQWSYLQEDPAFSDADLEGELIPFDDVPAWMAARHGITSSYEAEDEWEMSRKHPRDENEENLQDEEYYIDDQNPHEVAEEPEVEGPRTKRQKQEDSKQVDGEEVMEEARSESTPETLVVIANARGGTPCLANVEDEAWAPEPGERATSPPDPTEALLASLGVSGDAKPVKQNSLPPYMAGVEENPSPRSGPASHTPIASQSSTTFPPADIQPNNDTPMNNDYPTANDPPPNQSQQMTNGSSMNAPPMNVPPMSGQPMNQGPPGNATQVSTDYLQQGQPPASYGPPVVTGYGNGHPMQAPYQNGPLVNPAYPPNPQYGSPTNNGYGNGPPYAQPPYGPPSNIPYTNGPPNNYSQGPPQYGPPRNPSYGSAPPYNGPPQPGYNQFGAPAPYHNASYSQPQYGPPAIQQYGSAPPVNYHQAPQYGQPRNASHGNAQQMPGNYGANTQMSPVQYNPPHSQQYPSNAYPNQQYGNGPVPQFGNANSQYPPAQMPLGNIANGSFPPRQDSGYASARGSYSNGPSPNGFNNPNGAPPQAQQDKIGLAQGPEEFNTQNAAHLQAQHTQYGEPSNCSQNGPVPSPQQENTSSQQSLPSDQEQNTSGDAPPDSSEKELDSKKKRKKKDTTLTDLEKELLGELDSTSTRKNPTRKAATKKPQPVVEAAYKYVYHFPPELFTNFSQSPMVILMISLLAIIIHRPLPDIVPSYLRSTAV
jgi:hypothetical protein